MTSKPEEFGLAALDYEPFFKYLEGFEKGGFIYPASMAREIGSSMNQAAEFLFSAAANGVLRVWSLPKVENSIFEQYGKPDLITDASLFDIEEHPITFDPVDLDDVGIICAFKVNNVR